MKKHLMSIITITILILFCVFKLASLAAEVTISKKSDLNISNLPDSLYIKGNAVVSASNDFILNHPNVYCIEHGKNLSMSSEEAATGKGYLYSKTVTKTIGDNNGLEQQIAYILNHNSYTTYEDSKKWYTPAQKALWKVIDVNGTGTFNDYATKDSITLANNSESKKLYDKSIAWKNAFNNGINASISSEYVNNGVKITVSGNFLEYDLLINGKSKMKGEKGSGDVVYTYTYSSSESGNINVQFNYVKKYTATFSIYSHSDFQNFIVVTNLKKDTNTSLSVDIPIDSDVSLQKYITKINGKDITTNDTSIDKRSGLKSSEADNKKETSAYYLRYNKNVKPEKNGNDGIDARTPYKYDVPVKIDYGDKVTYKIEVHNNENRTAAGITVADKLPYYKEKGKDTLYVTLKSIKDKNGKTISAKTDENNTRLKFGPISLDANASTWYEITVEFNKKYYKDSPIVNTAWLEGNVKDYYKNNARPNIHRIADRDYVQMKQYAVSLEKYVVKVGKNNLISDTNNANYNSSIADRSGHPYYNENGYDKSDDKNKVRVEPGDTITFNIRVRNTGDKNENYGAIKVKQIGDIPIPPTQLKYDTTYEITGNGGGKLEGNIFKFDSAQLIEPGSYVDIEVRYKLEISKDDTISSINSIKNTAVIKIITNRNDKEVEDSDGTDNNVDMDYLKTKIYAVGIEKYVTGVGTKDNANSLVTNPNNINYNCATAYRSGKERQAKKDDAVRVEPGDYVTFTIKVKNTGTDYVNYGKINTTTISEVFSNKDNEYKLVYAGITGATYDKKQITFVQDIVPGGSATFTIKFEVEVARDKTNYKQLLYNAAQINDIKNGNGTPVKDSKEETDKDNEDRDYLLTKIYAVGIEKYVTGVGENGLITSTDDINYNCNVNSRENHPQYNKNGYDKSLEANRVRVEPGDYVTFTIKVKNTGTKDGKADYANYGKISTTTISESFTENANCKLVYDSITGASYNNKLITFKKDIIPGGSETFTIRFKVEVTGNLTGTQQNLENTVTIDGANSLSNKNSVPVKDSDGDKNNTDSDYLRTKIYAVGIEKYVTGVGTKDNANSLVTNPNNINYNCATAYRSGKERQAKKDDAVRVEPGDYVTFTIKVKNTGTDYVNYGKINTTTISEVFSNKDNEYKLVYAGITGATYDKKQITFVQDIVPGGSATFTIKFEVEVARDKTNYKQLLYNAAQINDIKNGNGTPVKDSKEETDNDNEDKDYLLTKIYKVALEKYVTKVNGYDLSTTAGKDYNVKELTDRKGKPTYGIDKSKENDIVNLETGDTVTFAITVKNIGDDYKDYGTVKTLNITDTSSKELKYNNVCTGARYSDGNITGVSAINVGDETTISLDYMVELNKNQTKQKIDLYNHAEIVDTSIINKNDISVKDSDGDKNNKDEDYLRTKVYAVSLEKYVSNVVDKSGNDITDKIKMGPKKDGENQPRKGYPEYRKNNDTTKDNELTDENNCDKTKRKNPVTTVTGDSVTYTILLKNDSEAKTGIDTTKDSNNDKNSYNTAIEIGNVIDYLPNGMQYDGTEYTNDNYKVTYDFKTSNGQTLSSGRLLYPGKTAIVTITATVIEDKMSLNILKNVAEINENSLINKKGSEVYDTTENNNRDADYIQLNYKHDPNPEDPEPGDDDNIFFAGTVWNDMALDKTGYKYNGEINTEERKLNGIKVFLYRDEYGLVAYTDTDKDGKYSFGDNDLQNEKNDKYFKKDDMSARYIKGPKKSKDDNRWNGYYSYYILFEYDGITYTSTPDGNSCANIIKDDESYKVDSNASEDRGKATQKRAKFNNNIQTIVDNKEIQYYQKNDDGYIPESRYIYEASKMSIQSSTDLIELSEFINNGTDKCLECSKYIGLGLRGRDIFDLELTSEVSRVEVTVNNIVGNYEYTNKVNVRKEDVNSNYLSDMANSYTSSLKEGAQYVQTAKNGDENDSQIVRKTDLDKSLTNTNGTEYSDGNLLNSIYVIYKISVNNASPTPGYATQIVDYYDKKYQLEGVYTDEKCNSDSKCTNYSDESTSDYNYVIVKDLKEIYDIYVKLQLTDAKKVLTENAWDKGMATYNMAEIYQYETGINKEKGQTEYTRGLIDKDSAPGSVTTETVRLTEGTSDRTTVQYYFTEHDKLNKLKYEDDTYATPTLYFTTPGSIRVLRGTVFEDYTDVYTTDRTRTGNGVKDDIEPGIKGAKVQLLEGCSKETYDAQTDTNLKYKQGRRDYYVVRYQTTTDKNGEFKFTNYLPGNYIMRYFYGDNQETFYIGDTNTKSYNGEDFQATNNYQEVDGAGVHILPTNENYWYTYNYDEGVSTATDIAYMRKQVSTAACELSDDEMELLNNVRDGKVKVPEAGKMEDGTISSLRDKLDMQAKTKQFTLTVEKSIKGKQNDEFDVYEVNKMNFGIAEVPVTTIDLQKHVNSFEIKDSTVENTIASAEITDEYIVEINKHNITDKNKYNKVKAALEKAGVDHSLAEYNTSEYGDSAKNENILVSSSVKKDKVDNLRGYLITYSIPNIITITPTWKTVGNVLPGVKTTNTVLDVSIEDAKLQGAKLKITYDIAVSMYAEKDFSGTESLQPSIDKVIDLIDNGVSYSDLLNSEGQWKVANASELKRGDSDPSETSGLESYPSTEFTTTIIESDSSNELLAIRAGYTESTSVTVERVLTSQDTSIQDIITSSIDAFEYQNTVKILQLDYTNSKVKIDGEEIKNKDRIRTPERYIIVPGKHHDSARSETIAIHPPTGDTSTHTMYYIIGAAGLAVLAIGAFGIKKFVLKCKGIKK